MEDFGMARESFRTCAIFSLTQEVRAFAKGNEKWELRFTSSSAYLVKNGKDVTAVQIINGIPTAVIHGDNWTQQDMTMWAKKYAGCLGDLANVVLATVAGESGLVSLS